ncbi:MAG: hypothetical protein K0S62_1091 [Kosakonia cowanii]|jgi:hypothetical protein|nr:hypothetical protein [Kosakonia cowanii]
MADLTAKDGSFAWAILKLQSGYRVTRRVWGDTNMYLIRNPGLTEQVVQENDWRAAAGVAIGTSFNYLPNIELCNAQKDFVPWVATQEDFEATDWNTIDKTEQTRKLIFDMKVIKYDNPDGEIYGYVDSSGVNIIQSPELISQVTAVETWYLPDSNPAQCRFLIIFLTDNTQNDDQLVAELSERGIQIIIDNIIYDMSQNFRAYTFAATSGHEVRFAFEDFDLAYKLHQYFKKRLGTTLRVYADW